MPTYGRLDISFIKGEGAWLTDDQGRNYLDALSGIAVTGLGHAHPAIAKALAEQASTLIHTSNLYHIPLQQRLADKLCALSGMEQAFFCNSGAEANEAAIKIARKYGHSRGIDKPVVIVMDGSFHGRTMATLTATGNTKVQTGFEPLLPGFVRVPFNDLDALRMAISHWPEAVAVLVEPVQGEGGIKVPDSDYLTGVRQICTQRKLLMMLDEVQSGIGRTGKMFAYQHNENLIPDVLSLAKGLGNGVPVGACLVAGTATGILGPGNHGSTFGGNPLACCAALTVLETIENDALLPRVIELGDRIKNGFAAKLGDHAGIREIRGSGLMIGIELTIPCAELVKQALDNGLLINVTATSVVRLLPPFILSDAEADKIVDDLSALILHFLDTHAVESVA
jgi:acetylornithine aminotransferase